MHEDTFARVTPPSYSRIIIGLSYCSSHSLPGKYNITCFSWNVNAIVSTGVDSRTLIATIVYWVSNARLLECE